MKAISFELSGKTACFRKPDVNQYVYFTYNNIHKPALLGILGAILGLGGHIQLHNKNRGLKANDKKFDNGFPEFYEKLKHLKISIIPLSPCGYFTKKIQVFNNSVGYASTEAGGNLIVREQWLENPKWRIMIMEDGSNEFIKLKEYLLNKKSIFTPYLGKNDHIAKIDEVKEISLKDKNKDNKLSSLFIENKCQVGIHPAKGESSFYFKEVSPISFQKEYHFYEYESLIFTNHLISYGDYQDIYSYENENYFFI